MTPRRPGRRVIKPPEQRRSDLLAAALRLFEERGYESVTVADVAEAARVAKGTFYLYFESKEQLLEALRRQFAASAADRLLELGLPQGDDDWESFTDQLVRLAIAFQVEQYELHELVRLPHRHGGESDPRGGPLDQSRLALRRIVEAGVAARRYAVSDLETTADLVYDVLHAAGDRACHQPDERESIAAAASALLCRGLLRA